MERRSLAAGIAYGLALATCVAMGASGCADPASPADRALPERNLFVFAAASMQPVMDTLALKFESTQHIKMTIGYASSSALAQQIQNGAPADLYISADTRWVDTLEAAGFVATRSDFLGNSLVIVVPVKSEVKATTAEDLVAPEIRRVAIGDPESVPAGKYAKEALGALGVWERVAHKLVPAMDVRQALLYVERGEADAGIVYSTDAKNNPSVRVVAALDTALVRPIRYALVLVKRNGRNSAAQAGYDFLLSDVARADFEAAGFTRLAAKPAGAGK